MHTGNAALEAPTGSRPSHIRYEDALARLSATYVDSEACALTPQERRTRLLRTVINEFALLGGAIISCVFLAVVLTRNVDEEIAVSLISLGVCIALSYLPYVDRKADAAIMIIPRASGASSGPALSVHDYQVARAVLFNLSHIVVAAVWQHRASYSAIPWIIISLLSITSVILLTLRLMPVIQSLWLNRNYRGPKMDYESIYIYNTSLSS